MKIFAHFLFVVVLLPALAFADGHSMVKLDGCFDGRCDNLDLNMNTDTNENTTNDPEEKAQTIALNYAMAFGGKRTKPDWHFQFKDETRLKAKIEETLKGFMQSVQLKGHSSRHMHLSIRVL